jgi:hypothetical protein
VASRRELIEAVVARYCAAACSEKKKILDEFVSVTGFHHEAVQQALLILWEAADRICGKRLNNIIPTLLDAMERHGHLNLDAEVRQRLLAMSAATMDRLLKTSRAGGKQGRRTAGINTPLRKSIAVRTFGDWNDPPPGYFEMDMVAHCGKSVTGSHVHSLVLTDIASGWTEGRRCNLELTSCLSRI